MSKSNVCQYICRCNNIISFALICNRDIEVTCAYCGNIVSVTYFSEQNDELMGKTITPNNYIGHYTTWCIRNSFVPLSYEVLQEVFIGCITNEDYKTTLEFLYDFQCETFNLSFLTSKIYWHGKDMSLKPDSIQVLAMRLKLRLELFKRVPTATNMLLAYNMIEELTLKVFQSGDQTMSDKDIERFDKLKNLALSTKYIHERKLAFERSVETFKKLTQIEM